MRRTLARSLFFPALILAFFIATPLLLLRSSGYRINTARWRIVPTGALAIMALPTGTEITLKESTLAPEMSTTFSSTVFFSNLLPETYLLQARHNTIITQHWEKVANVEGKRATWFPFVRLFPAETAPLNALLPRIPQGVATDPTGTKLIGWDDRGILGIDLAADTPLSALEQSLAGSIDRVEWLSSTAILIRFRNGAWILAEDVAGTAPHIFPLPASVVDVAPINETTVAARFADGRLYVLQRERSAFRETLIIDNAVAIDANEHALFWLDDHNILWTIRPDGTDRAQRTVVPLPAPMNTRANAPPFTLILDHHGTTAVMIDENNVLWFVDKDSDRFIIIAEGIENASFSPNDTKMLLVGTHEVSFYAARERLDQPVRPKGYRETITRLGEVIQSAVFLPPEGEHVLVRTDETLRIIELDGRGGRNEATFPQTLDFAVSGDSQRVIVVDPKGALAEIPIPIPGILSRLPR